MNILITGVTGHVGYSSIIRLLSAKNKIFGVYNKKISNSLRKKFKNKPISLVKLNLLNTKKIKKFIKQNKIKCCVHAAAVSHEIYVKKNIKNTLDINSNVVFNFLEVQKKNKFKFILISTGSVFQNVKNLKKISENTVPSPVSLYAGSKRLGEILVDTYRKYYKNDACVLRLSWVYGPPIITKKVNIQRGPIPILLYDLIVKNKKNFYLKSGRDFEASFTYIDDVTNNLAKLINMKKFNKTIYHLGSGKNSTLKQFFAELKKIYPGIKFKLGKGAKPWSNDSVMRPPLASNENIKIKINLYKGIIKYSNWLKKNA